VVPVLRAAGTLDPSFAESASKTAFLKMYQKDLYKYGQVNAS
jgi:hypothetical protein